MHAAVDSHAWKFDFKNFYISSDIGIVLKISSRIEFAVNGPEERPIGGHASVFGGQEFESTTAPLSRNSQRSNEAGDGTRAFVAISWLGRGTGSPIDVITPSKIDTKDPIYDQDLAISRRNSSPVWMRKIANPPSNGLVAGSLYRSTCSAIAVEIQVWLGKIVRQTNFV
jgi:hypothetical protein